MFIDKFIRKLGKYIWGLNFDHYTNKKIYPKRTVCTLPWLSPTYNNLYLSLFVLKIEGTLVREDKKTQDSFLSPFGRWVWWMFIKLCVKGTDELRQVPHKNIFHMKLDKKKREKEVADYKDKNYSCFYHISHSLFMSLLMFFSFTFYAIKKYVYAII